MTNKKTANFLIGFLILLFPLQVKAADSKGGYSPDVAAFMETDGMTVFGDPEIMAIQAKMAEYAQKEDFTTEDTEKATALLDHLIASIEQISREYMSGKRVAKNPEHTVLDKKELPSCMDDGSCSSKKQPEQLAEVVEQEPSEQSYQKTPEQTPAEQTPVEETRTSFGEMLNSKKPSSLEEIRASLKL